MLIYQKIIKRTDLQLNPTVLYVFGDNMERVGFGGQAAEMRNEPNAVGIPTKRKPSMTSDSFLYDEDFELWFGVSKTDFNRLLKHTGLVVWPADGIGTGLANLTNTSPKIFTEILRYVEKISLHSIAYKTPTNI